LLVTLDFAGYDASVPEASARSLHHVSSSDTVHRRGHRRAGRGLACWSGELSLRRSQLDCDQRRQPGNVAARWSRVFYGPV